ncbi:DUF3164 family protein [Methylomonas sp. ZR1]|uniref:DUF3164 family protein n=1 Tax=Methylomonas sp. ZR1 TaxID=1797072 RepID=UPI001490F6ED|nr:DUF3164 family protein [Methylomonas sp. ZR1]NOV29197.1 DUF3164 family protein [Methylomonas sp. ZR1]
MNTPTTLLPPGYRADSFGRLVPEDGIKKIDLLRDDTVKTIVKGGLLLQEQMRTWKHQVLADIAAFCELSAEQYGVKWGGKKGNLSLVSYDGKYKVLLAVSDALAFDERLQVAKTLIDECIHEWTANSNTEIKVLVEHAFQADRQGKINTGRIFGLMRVKIEHPKWKEAMDALKDSIQVTSTSEYLRMYERIGDTNQYRQITMDIAGL